MKRRELFALWLQTPHLPLKVRLAVHALAAAFPEVWQLSREE
ncbi:hypothetical protein [Rhizobium laguerreae]|nr:hypothetical protein [Rhizobium laguerreae]